MAAKGQPAQNRSHNMSYTRVYRSWADMKTRCLNPRFKYYDNYGGRGITVCTRWLHSFETFLEDMGFPPTSQHTLERKDNDGDYSPENCRWATHSEQCRNRRSSRLITIGDETRTLAEWIERSGIKRSTVHQRFYVCGWSIEKSLQTPARTWRAK